MPKTEFTGLSPVEIEGARRKKNRLIYKGAPGLGRPKIVSSQRTSRIYGDLAVTGNMRAIPVAKTEGVETDKIPHIERKAAGLVGIFLGTVLKKKTAIPGYKALPKETSYRLPKTGGINSPYEKTKIEEIRRANEKKRNWLKGVINAGLLLLFIHDPLHRQENSVQKTPIQPLPKYKKGGIRPEELREMERQRKKYNKSL